MVLQTIRTPRGENVLRRNECLNPSVENNTTGWVYSWFNGGAGNDGVGTDGGYSGSRYLYKRFTAASSNSGDVGFGYRHDGWTAGAQKTASAYLRSRNINTTGRVSLMFYNGAGGVIGQTYGSPAYLSPNTWTRVVGTDTAPAGTAYTIANFYLTSEKSLPVTFQLDCDACLIEPGAVASQYIDGDTWAAGNGEQRTVWAGAAHASQSLVYLLDSSTKVYPTLIVGYDVSQDSLNVVHVLDDGTIGVSLRGSSSRKGTLRLFFADKDAAETARQAHAGIGTWQWTDDANPRESLKYAVVGTVRKYQSDSRRTWMLEVPFQEVP